MVRAVVDVSTPAPTLVAVMSPVVGFSAAVSAPAPTLRITGLTGGILSAALSAPAPLLAAVGHNPPALTSVLTAPAPRLVITGVSGNVLSAALTAPVPGIAVTGYPAYIATAALIAPAPRLSATLIVPVAAPYRTWVLNTRELALTEYDAFEFNSYALFNGQVLACGASGVVVLGAQDLDDDVAIDARGRTGADSLNMSYLKRIPRLYVSYSSPGDMLFRTITKEGGTRTYSLPFNGITELQQRRVPVGKGPKSRYWQYEFVNVNGSDFLINDLLAYPIALRRRVQ